MIEIVPINILEPDKEAKWDLVRKRRNSILKATDWTVLPDSTPEHGREAWIDYRKKLRDVTDTFNDPENIIWPEPPFLYIELSMLTSISKD
jgi:hypothetical protein